MDQLHGLIKSFLIRHRRRRRIARADRIWTVTRLVVPHAVRLNINFASVISRAYIQAWKGEK